MYAYIKGELEEKTTSYVVVETMGIGYKIFMSRNSILQIGEIGSSVKVYTHYHVREDDISLYGFSSNEELRMFELLISVSGVGAKSAITMLSEITPSKFALDVVSDDITSLTKIPGVGKKTAARIILELKDKLKQEQAIEAKEEIKTYIESNERVEEAITALQVLGYNKREIESVFSKINLKDLELEDIIKNALKYLGRN